MAGLATVDMTAAEAGRLADHVRRLGRRVLYGSDAATGGNPPPREAWAAFARLPLTPDELEALATTEAPYAH